MRLKKLAAGASRPPETKPSREEHQSCDQYIPAELRRALVATTLRAMTGGNAPLSFAEHCIFIAGFQAGDIPSGKGVPRDGKVRVAVLNADKSVRCGRTRGKSRRSGDEADKAFSILESPLPCVVRWRLQRAWMVTVCDSDSQKSFPANPSSPSDGERVFPQFNSGIILSRTILAGEMVELGQFANPRVRLKHHLAPAHCELGFARQRGGLENFPRRQIPAGERVAVKMILIRGVVIGL